jgi:hypothetical protein
MARSRLTSSASRSRPMKLVRARGKLCLLLGGTTAAKSASSTPSSFAGKRAASGKSGCGKVPAQISCCRRVVATSGSMPNSLKSASLSLSYWPTNYLKTLTIGYHRR